MGEAKQTRPARRSAGARRTRWGKRGTRPSFGKARTFQSCCIPLSSSSSSATGLPVSAAVRGHGFQDGERASLRLVLCLRLALGAGACAAPSVLHSRGHHVCEKRCGQRSSVLGWKRAGISSCPRFRLRREQLVGSFRGRRMVQQCHHLPGTEAHPVEIFQEDGEADCLLRNPERRPGVQPRLLQLEQGQSSATKLHYRGARIWQAVMEDLLAKGMNKAENALISGCSAGGLTSILHCDRFHNLLPMGAKVKCLSDAGFFINVKDVAGEGYIAAFFNNVVTTHTPQGSAENLSSSGTSMLPPGMYFFPQNEVKQIQTPLFVFNAAYDSWQVINILVPGVADRHGKWRSCKHDRDQCSAEQLRYYRDSGMIF